jgi:hypothetical protein
MQTKVKVQTLPYISTAHCIALLSNADESRELYGTFGNFYIVARAFLFFARSNLMFLGDCFGGGVHPPREEIINLQTSTYTICVPANPRRSTCRVRADSWPARPHTWLDN